LQWMSTVKGISGPLMYIATMYALRHGKLYAVTELKERIARRAEELGWQVHAVKDARLLLDRIPEVGRGYYVTPPTPRLVMASLKEKEAALRDRTMDAIFEGKIVLDFSA